MIYTILVGIVAGWLAGQIMKGGGYGLIGDLILGIVGSWLGSWLFAMLGLWPGGGVVGSIIVSTIGAVVLVALVRFLKRT